MFIKMKIRKFVFLMGKTSGIPEEIKLGDTVYKVKEHPEVLELIEIVRKEEKTKLYAEKADLEAKIKVLEAVENKSKDQEKTLKKLQDDLIIVNSEKSKVEKELAEIKKTAKTPEELAEEERKRVEKEKAEKEKASSGLTAEEVSKIVSEQLKKTTEVYQKALEKKQAEFDELRKNFSDKNVAEYRNELLEKNKGLVIPDLVTGSTKEELDKSLVTALQTSKKYLTTVYNGKTVTLFEKDELVKKAEEKAEADKAKRNQGTPPNKFSPPDGGEEPDVDGKTLIKDVSSMSAEEYSKYRKKILDEVKQLKYQSDNET
jgi:hypothetical protein